MTIIWVDADATPKAVREIICRAAVRTETTTRFVANHRIPLPPSPFLINVQVEAGFDVADNLIAQQAQPGDLVISQDIPLAAEVLEKQVDAINNRGEPYSPETIRQKLNMRDFMETLRSSGVQSGGPAPFSDKDKQTFANALDRWLAKHG
ncbi:YaiI/YqxD family protein [Bacterioplanoides sp.]|uniref:YaiI/YqxD family protein n=1 Tax=Bacterioplanoides sp. TaxID=2066072 RepID=UPI003AFF7AE3